jgi:hypothetical protein
LIKELSLAHTKISTDDIALSVAKSFTGTLPLIGPALNELIDLAITSPLQKRQAEWQSALADTVNQLIKTVDGVTADSLSKNDEFLTAVVAASNIAMKTSRCEKIKILQAMIYQSGSGFHLEDFIQNTFLQIIDRYTPEHVSLLQRLADAVALQAAFHRLRAESPDKVGRATSTEPELGEHCKIEDLAGNIVLGIEQVTANELFADLHRDGLCHGSEGFAFSYYINRPPIIVTDRGKAFLRFVTLDHD